MSTLSIDIETFSSVDLKKSGLYKYVQAHDFEVLLFAYAIDDSPVTLVDLKCGEQIPPTIVTAMFDNALQKRAYNAAFEWYCLSKHFGLTEAHSLAWLSQWRCTMLHGLYCGYTIGLAATGEALQLPQSKQKLSTGSALIRTFCIPCKPTNTNGNRLRTLPHHEPERWRLFKDYCAKDVEAERAITQKLSGFPVPDDVQAQWVLDMRINARGVAVDTDLMYGAISCDESITTKLSTEAALLTGLHNPNSRAQLLRWFQETVDDTIPDLQKATVTELLASDLSSDTAARRVLELRQQLSKASTSKYRAMSAAVCEDGRIRGTLQFYGANRTGRWAGRIIQPQNLPRTHLSAIPYARDLVKQQSIPILELLYGDIPHALSQLIRTALVAPEGKQLISADFSAIEARVIAWLAGEQWRLDVFATHGKIYEASASQMFGVPLEKISKGNPEYELRQKGKVAELALGYQGSSGALTKMGALQMGLTAEELPDIVSKWRATNLRIVDLWHACEQAAISVVQFGTPAVARGIQFAREFDTSQSLEFLTIALPSGRKLYYAQPHLTLNQWDKPAVSYYGMNQTTKKWGESDLYGGRLVENIVQAIARDCLAETIVRLEALQYPVVFHVHDEVILEVDTDTANADLEEICAVMARPIAWAHGLVLRADGYISPYYKKE